MKRNNHNKGTHGFTLVELLVVMAIIAILASIVVPNVAKYITRSRMTNALSEVRNAETAFTGMLSAAQVANYRQFFNPNEEPWATYIPSLNAASQVYASQLFYTEAFYLLLRYGKDAEAYVTNDMLFQADYPAVPGGVAVGLDNNVIAKLGTSEMELDKDPWDNLYYVYAGPWRIPLGGSVWDPNTPPFRTRSIDLTIPGNRSRELNENVGGVGITTFRAPKDLPIYIYSAGQDKQAGQSLLRSVGGYLTADSETAGGGDDIGNWDTEQSFQELYN